MTIKFNKILSFKILFDQHNEIVDKIYDFMENAHQLGESVLVHSIRG
jgi:hypothetical protein